MHPLAKIIKETFQFSITANISQRKKCISAHYNTKYFYKYINYKIPNILEGEIYQLCL